MIPVADKWPVNGANVIPLMIRLTVQTGLQYVTLYGSIPQPQDALNKSPSPIPRPPGPLR